MSYPFKYIRDYYRVPACIGRKVVCYGKPGIITADRGQYIGVTLDTDKPSRISNYHPVDGIEYGEMGVVRKPSRSAARYAAYREVADLYDDFFQWLRHQQYKKETEGATY